MSTVYFYTCNEKKAREAQVVLGSSGRVTIMKVSTGITEILETNLERLIREKAMATYAKVQLPVIVEHGEFRIEYLNGLPGTLIQPFWLGLGARLCDLVPAGQRQVTVRSAVCYCDGRQVKPIIKDVKGTLAPSPRGSGGFHWDPIFIPDGHTKTFAELAEVAPEEKLKVSPGGIAWREMADFLKTVSP